MSRRPNFGIGVEVSPLTEEQVAGIRATVIKVVTSDPEIVAGEVLNIVRQYRASARRAALAPPAEEVRFVLDGLGRDCRTLIRAVHGLEEDSPAASVARVLLMDAGHDLRAFDRPDRQTPPLLDQLYKLAKAVGRARQSRILIPGKGRRSDEALVLLVSDLGETYRRETGKPPTANWSDSTGGYAGPFLRFVFGVMDAIGDPYEPNIVGDKVRAVHRSKGKMAQA